MQPDGAFITSLFQDGVLRPASWSRLKILNINSLPFTYSEPTGATHFLLDGTATQPDFIRLLLSDLLDLLKDDPEGREAILDQIFNSLERLQVLRFCREVGVKLVLVVGGDDFVPQVQRRIEALEDEEERGLLTVVLEARRDEYLELFEF